MDDAQKFAACVALSVRMREALCLYNLKERELRLANWLILETYDRGQFVGVADFSKWARELGYWDAKSIRPKQCMEEFIELKNLGLLDWNQAEGTFELRPHHHHWTGLRLRGLLSEVEPKSKDLPLRAERLLPEALSEVSREQALTSGPDPVDRPLQGMSRDWPALYKRLQEALSSRDPEQMERLQEDFEASAGRENQERQKGGGSPANFTGDRRISPVNPPAKNAGNDYRRNSPVTQDAQNAELKTCVNDIPVKFAGAPIASLALSTKAKLAIGGGVGEGLPVKFAGADCTPERAWRYLESVDRRGTLRGRFAEDYRSLCEQMPQYVLEKLKWALEEHLRYYRQNNPNYGLPDPVGWMGRKAADAGHMRWRGRRS